ncbi:MAG: hypothetical protein ACFLMY_07890 [Candidatus Brachytrichaceae bacterium NZ_4S206]|jgi:outer membrane lipoprotein-sorting protein
MKFPDLLELLYTAHKRFSSVHVAWRYWYRVGSLNEAVTRWSAQCPYGSVSMLKSAESSTRQGEEDEREMTIHWRIWFQKPTFWRSEYQPEGRQDAILRIRDGQHWWLFDPARNHAVTNVRPSGGGFHIRESHESASAYAIRMEDVLNDVPLLDPSFLLASHDLRVIGDDIHAGRQAIRVQAFFRTGKQVGCDPLFWSTADDYELLVDKERGILLRYAARLKGKAFAIASVEEVVYDLTIPQHVFTFTPPPDASVEIVT